MVSKKARICTIVRAKEVGMTEVTEKALVTYKVWHLEGHLATGDFIIKNTKISAKFWI